MEIESKPERQLLFHNGVAEAQRGEMAQYLFLNHVIILEVLGILPVLPSPLLIRKLQLLRL